MSAIRLNVLRLLWLASVWNIEARLWWRAGSPLWLHLMGQAKESLRRARSEMGRQ